MSGTAPRKKSRRRAYHHGDLATALVEEATKVVEAHGHEAVSVRDVARTVGVSPAAPFRHFADREDLLRAVCLAAQKKLARACDDAVAEAGDDPLQQFRAVGLANLRFAIAHPEWWRLFRVASLRQAPSTATDEDRAFLAELEAQNERLVLAAQAHGSMREGNPAVLALAGVALANGLAQFFLDGTLQAGRDEPLAVDVLDVLGSGFVRRT